MCVTRQPVRFPRNVTMKKRDVSTNANFVTHNACGQVKLASTFSFISSATLTFILNVNDLNRVH